METRGKKGQVAVYVIIALAIVAVVLLILLYPRLKPSVSTDVSGNPQAYIESCLKPAIINEISQRAVHGGEVNPEAFILYKNEKIKYLCYTSDKYKTCVVQDPLIKERMEDEISKDLNEDAGKCVDLLVQAFQSQGFSVSKTNTKLDVSINPEAISVTVNSPMTVTKDVSRNFNIFTFNIPSKYYEVLYIASSIVDYESAFGNSITENYLAYYPDITISKDQLDDGTRVYSVENFNTHESFSFASKSLVWPPGGDLRI